MIYVTEDIPSQVKFWKNISYLIVIKLFLWNWILAKLNAYFFEFSTLLYKIINIIWKRLTKLIILTAVIWQTYFYRLVSKVDFNFEEKWHLWRLSFISMIMKILLKKVLFTNYSKPAITDLFLTNSNTYFQNTKTIFTGLSDFDKLFKTMLGISFPKSKRPENYTILN